jgi:hypothetical protein
MMALSLKYMKSGGGLYTARARAHPPPAPPRLGRAPGSNEPGDSFFFGGAGAYTQQGRAHIRRLHPDWAARPALMSRAAHAVESKAVVRIEVAVGQPTPLPGLRCGTRLARRAALSAAASHPGSA